MKLHTPRFRILIFFLMTLIPVLLPLFMIQGTLSYTEWKFPFQQLYLALFAVIIITQNPELPISKTKDEENQKKNKGFLYKVTFFICVFAALTVISFTMQKLGNLIVKKSSVDFLRPSDPKAFAFCSLNFLLSAFYEESIYRFFLPEALLFLTSEVQDQKMMNINCEIIACTLFALGHVYLGVLSVINAAIAYIILRICYKKTGSLVPGIAAHFLYNLSQLFFI